MDIFASEKITASHKSIHVSRYGEHQNKSLELTDNTVNSPLPGGGGGEGRGVYIVWEGGMVLRGMWN